eukprot:jgi/Orpsp1_1/1179401/evm.model.c7180000069182.1
MNNLQSRIIHNSSFKTNYLLVNNLKRINLSLSLNAYKSSLTSNVKYTNLKSLQIKNSQSNILSINEKINCPSFIFKSRYSQFANEDNSNDNDSNEKVENNEIPNDTETTKKETSNESGNNNSDNKNNNESKGKNDKTNTYSIILGLIAISTAGAMKVQKKIIEKKLEDLENETQIKIEGSPL